MAESNQIDSKAAAGDADAAFDFDPWTATIEQALQFVRLAKPGSQEPLAQRAAAQEVQALRLACLEHDGGCKVLHCLKLCLANGLMPPSWLSDAFIQRHNQVVNSMFTNPSQHKGTAIGAQYGVYAAPHTCTKSFTISLADSVCEQLCQKDIDHTTFEKALRNSVKERKRRDRLLKVYDACMQLGLSDPGLTLRRTSLFGAVADLPDIALSVEAVETNYYAALLVCGVPSLLSERLNTKKGLTNVG